jgi:hypothetical protein
MSPSDFIDLDTLAVTGHSLGGGCASMLAVLMNDGRDPLGFGDDRKVVGNTPTCCHPHNTKCLLTVGLPPPIDELYGFGPTPVFHDAEAETLNCQVSTKSGKDGSFTGGIFRAVKETPQGLVQDRAFNLVHHGFHHPKINLINLRSRHFQPEVYSSSRINEVTKETLVDDKLFPLHSPKNYCDWMGESQDRVKYVWQN